MWTKITALKRKVRHDRQIAQEEIEDLRRRLLSTNEEEPLLLSASVAGPASGASMSDYSDVSDTESEFTIVLSTDEVWSSES